MSEAIVALVGVVIGGLLSAGTTWWIEQVRERREARAAARLVQHELMLTAALLDVALEMGRSAPFTEGFPTRAWNEHREALARSLDTRAWAAVLAAYMYLPALEGTAHAAGVEGRAFDGHEHAMVREAMERTTDALDVLGRVGNVPSLDRSAMIAFAPPAGSEPPATS